MADNKYSGVRPYIEQPVIIPDEATELNIPKDLKEYIYKQSVESELAELSYNQFDIGDENAATGNILNDFIAWKNTHPEFFTLYKLAKHPAAVMEYKSRLLAQHLYGDPSLFYVIMIFNDITNEAELTKERLEKHGIIVLNAKGVEALKEILAFKRRYEYNYEEPFAASEF